MRRKGRKTMKGIKKILAVMVAMVMTLGLAATNVFADETYSINITNAKKGETYNAYKVFEASYTGSGENTKVSYWIDSSSAFYDTVSAFAAVEDNGLTLQQVGSSTRYNVIADTSKFTEAKAGELAVNLNADSTKPNVSGTVTPNADGAATIRLESAGYYLVDTTLGAVCALNTNTPTADITEKNTTTTQDKTVQENSTTEYGDKNDAQVGDTVNFKSVVTIGKHQKNVKFHDVMQTAKLALKSDSITVTGVDSGKYTVKTGEQADSNDTFTVVFDNEWTQSLTENTTVTITYSAVLTNDAIVGLQTGLAMGAGNDNKSQVTYGDAQHTEWDWTRTYTWGIDVLKYTEDSSSKTPLSGATFVFKKGNKYATFNNDGLITGWADTLEGATKLVTPENGTINLKGLDADTYALEEIEAPAGYNKLTKDIVVIIDSNTDSAQGTDGNSQSATVTYKQDGTEVNRVEVLNQAGTTLPSTGGIGTTIFYAIGSILVVGAGVLLISKKRMFN